MTLVLTSIPRIILLLAAFQTASTNPLPQHVDFVLPKACISNVQMPEHFECRGPDEKHLTCGSFILTVVPNCGRWEISRVPQDHK